MILLLRPVPVPGKSSNEMSLPFFNALNFAIALALAFVQAWSNLVFFAVICFNAFSGIVTELRAKHMVDKLNLMTKEKVKTIRDGQEVALNPENWC